MKKFQNKYRIASARAVWWNYSNQGWYFVTICSYNRQFFFGDVSDQKIELSEIGQLVHQFWCEIPNHFAFVKLHAFVVMPNHVHGIVEIVNHEETLHARSVPRQEIAEQYPKNEKLAGISPQKGSLASIIRSFKSAVTREARKINSNFKWQERFHDRIIRNDQEYHRIANDINNNSMKWEKEGCM